MTDAMSGVTTYAFDARGLLLSVTNPLSQVTSYTYDAAGNRTSVSYGGQTEFYTLDALNRITSVTYPGGATVSYTYDAQGNRLTKTDSGGTTNYTYDDAGQLTSDGTKTYTHDANGNMTGAGADSFAYDWANRMTSSTVGGVTTSYAYAGDDTRAPTTTGGQTTTYLWDRESGLPQLIDDGTDAYLHAGGVLASVPVTGSPQYMLDDALGSVRGLSDSTGMLSGTADHDVFGPVRQSSGGTSIFGFTGEQLGAETGWTYLGARYLNPLIGRFTQSDSVQPNAEGTQGFNLYAYVANNPTTWSDPTGHTIVDDIAWWIKNGNGAKGVVFPWAFISALYVNDMVHGENQSGIIPDVCELVTGRSTNPLTAIACRIIVPMLTIARALWGPCRVMMLLLLGAMNTEEVIGWGRKLAAHEKANPARPLDHPVPPSVPRPLPIRPGPAWVALAKGGVR